MCQQPLIINLAPTGAVADARKNPAVPVDNAAIADAVAECAAAGATVCHLHVRDDAAAPSCDPSRFADLIGRIRGRPGGSDLVLCATTSGRHGQSLEDRAAVLSLPREVRPDLASLTLGSLNFPTAASVNAPDTIRFLADRMKECDVKPELEIFDVGMIEFAKILIAEGRIVPPFYFNLLLGNVGSLACSVEHLGFAMGQLPQPAIVSVGGIGRHQAAANALGVVAAGGVRVGLEDNLCADWATRSPATNLQNVERVVRLAREMGRPVATAAEARSALGL
jgi:3-keto-5-aminohexanoate cleavage enzyme